MLGRIFESTDRRAAARQLDGQALRRLILQCHGLLSLDGRGGAVAAEVLRVLSVEFMQRMERTREGSMGPRRRRSFAEARYLDLLRECDTPKWHARREGL